MIDPHVSFHQQAEEDEGADEAPMLLLSRSLFEKVDTTLTAIARGHTEQVSTKELGMKPSILDPVICLLTLFQTHYTNTHRCAPSASASRQQR
jgi:hypothetical protein